METIKNMCSNSVDVSTNTTNKLSDKIEQILNDLGLEDTNTELESGYRLLNQSYFANIESEFEEDILERYLKQKHQ